LAVGHRNRTALEFWKPTPREKIHSDPLNSFLFDVILRTKAKNFIWSPRQKHRGRKEG
jgi:hypothetical protein